MQTSPIKSPRKSGLSDEKNAVKQKSRVGGRIRHEKSVPYQFSNSLTPLNVFEQKDRFLRRRLTPEFQMINCTDELEAAILNETGNIKFNFFRDAKRIIDTVNAKFKTLDNFVEASFGKRISVEDASVKVADYISNANLPTTLDVIWCEELIGRKLFDQVANHGVHAHYCRHRSYNEGLQPWYGKRELYGLSPTNTYEAIKIEEGLACVNTILYSTYRYLAMPALLYYGSCMAEYLSFKDLFHHLGKYIFDEEQRWKHCMRIKRCLSGQEKLGGYGKDQRYFEGAVTVLRHMANIEFTNLMAGKLTLCEAERMRKSVLPGAVRLPAFMVNREQYIANLRQIANLNGIIVAPVGAPAPRPPALTLPRPSSSLVATSTPSIMISSIPNGGQRGSAGRSAYPTSAHHALRRPSLLTKNNIAGETKQLLKASFAASTSVAGESNAATSGSTGTGINSGGGNGSLAAIDTSATVLATANPPNFGDMPGRRAAFCQRFLGNEHLLDYSSKLIARPRTPSTLRQVATKTGQPRVRRRASGQGTERNYQSLTSRGMCGCHLFTSGLLRPTDRANLIDHQQCHQDHRRFYQQQQEHNTCGQNKPPLEAKIMTKETSVTGDSATLASTLNRPTGMSEPVETCIGPPTILELNLHHPLSDIPHA